jgi:leucyl-tRNA synthetase
MVLMLAPLTPHVAEELWEKLGEEQTLVFTAFPEAEPTLLVDEEVEIPVQVNGKVRGRVRVATGADDAAHEAAARADERVAALIDGVTVRKVVVVPGRLVNFVVG